MVESKLNPEALESYTKSFSTIIIDKFFADNLVITGQQIVHITPIRQVNFFVLKVLFNQWQEETKKFKSPFFNYNHEDVKQALKSLVNTMSKHIAIEKKDFGLLLEKAVKESLTLVYEPENYFSREINVLGDANFANTFKALSRYFKIRKNTFNQISNVLSEGNIAPNSTELDELIRKSCLENEGENIESEINLFNGVLPMDVLESKDLPVYEQQPVAVEEEENILKEEVEEEDSVIISKEKVIDTSFDDEFEPIEEESKYKEETDESPTNINEQFTAETPTINEQFEKEEKPSTVAEKHETQQDSELHSSISVNQRYMFLNDLFKGDVNEYDKAIEDIEDLDSFDNSVEYLMQNYSRKYQWDMGSDEIKELLKVIFKRFR